MEEANIEELLTQEIIRIARGWVSTHKQFARQAADSYVNGRVQEVFPRRYDHFVALYERFKNEGKEI